MCFAGFVVCVLLLDCRAEDFDVGWVVLNTNRGFRGHKQQPAAFVTVPSAMSAAAC
jgi:hypothetical protein